MTRRRAAQPRRDEALAFIVDRIARFGIAPSYAEIGRAMVPCVSRSRAKDYVDELMERGVIERDAGTRRGIRVRGQQPAPPTFGRIPVAPPFEHLPDID